MSKKARVPVNVLAKGSNPIGEYAGDLYFNTTTKSIWTFDGTSWTDSLNVNTSGIIFDGGAADTVYTGVSAIDGGGV